MKFLDQVKVHVASGKGGNGCVSFRHEKYVEFGGPDGGNGGKGSDIIFETNNNLNTLIDFRYQQHFKGKKGETGKGQNKTGANAKNIIIKIPKGTQILSEDKSAILSDMTEDNQKFTIDGARKMLSGKVDTLQSSGAEQDNYSEKQQIVIRKIRNDLEAILDIIKK